MYLHSGDQWLYNFKTLSPLVKLILLSAGVSVLMCRASIISSLLKHDEVFNISVLFTKMSLVGFSL